MATRAELRAIVRQDASLNSTDVISDADLNTLLLEGAVQFAKDGHAFITKTSWNTAASVSEYVLSGASPKVTGFLEVYWPLDGLIYAPTSSVTKLPGTDYTVVSEPWLNREYPGWKGLTASDTLQYVYLGYNSSGYLVLGTVPKASTTTPSITLWAVSSGTAMSDDANYPYVNSTTALAHIESYTKGIAYWALYVLHRDKTKINGEADKYLALYSSLAAQCRDATYQHVKQAETIGLRQAGMVVANQTVGSL